MTAEGKEGREYDGSAGSTTLHRHASDVAQHATALDAGALTSTLYADTTSRCALRAVTTPRELSGQCSPDGRATWAKADGQAGRQVGRQAVRQAVRQADRQAGQYAARQVKH